MKFEIYSEKPEIDDTTIYLRLVESESGCMTVIACDRDGERLECGNLLSFNTDGTITMSEGVGKHLGFQLDCDGRIKVAQ